ncbi:hypothetical protein NUU61_006174 [Penicillium alfredii]|uniref:Uncharacterized protein n=1 Tax=Penicillium alfredii TaxID=1506179 RepID=A0A9W9K327_9EURO|nr:uncharacterized protein NUU61_006174 [Penicillium alfredii]KAJ5091304.1 hypothetical protein NUU61_006174 [Penicillium alfredii]
MASDQTLFEPLHPVGDQIYLYEPQDTEDAPLGTTQAPALVILCTWLGGATPRRINKYVSQYRQIYPGSSLLLITTNFPDLSIRPFGMLRARLKPACQAITRILARPSNGTLRRTLLHMFSHGGCNVGLQMAEAMKEEADHGVAYFSSLQGIIFDCCPGDDTLQRAYGAALLSMPQTTMGQLLGKMLYPTLVVVTRLQHAGILYGVRDLRAQLNESTFGAHPRRLYIYSKEDVTVSWEDVKAHLEDARSRGYLADQVVFEHGSHCGLIMEDGSRYWTAVQKFWNGEDINDLVANSVPGASYNSIELKAPRSRL